MPKKRDRFAAPLLRLALEHDGVVLLRCLRGFLFVAEREESDGVTVLSATAATGQEQRERTRAEA